jgi:thioredoxin 1
MFGTALRSQPATPSTGPVGARPVAITESNFQSEVLESDVPVVIDFWAPWCGPCRQIGPVLDRLAAEHGGKVKVAKINVDEQQVLAGAFQIRGIPTLVVMKGGKAEGQIVGFPGAGPITDLFGKLSRGEPLR